MAQSRTERIGTVFSRISSLIKANSLEEENVPLWYNIYKAFPPKYEPRFDRPLPQKNIKKIFYAEDYLRAQFYKDVQYRVINLKSQKVTQSQIFINIYENLLKDNVKEEEVYDKALKTYIAYWNAQKLKQSKLSSKSSRTPPAISTTA